MIFNCRKNVVLLAALALSSVVGSNAFVTHTPNAAPRVKTEISVVDSIYGEESRLYRRTVYTHEEWKTHRSPDRFLKNLSTFTKSGIYTNVAREVFATTAVAALVVAFNAVAGGYTDLEGTKHAALFTNAFIGPLTVSMAPFTLSSPFLGLLLGMSTSDLPVCGTCPC